MRTGQTQAAVPPLAPGVRGVIAREPAFGRGCCQGDRMFKWLAAIATIFATAGVASAQPAPANTPPVATGQPGAVTIPQPALPGAAPPAAGQPAAGQPGQPAAGPRAPGGQPAAGAEVVGEGAMYDALRAYRVRDYPTALRLWRDEAERGNAQAMVNVGEMYAYAIGVPEDFAEAVRWFRRAADAGDMVGQFSLAFMYENGRGVPRNLTEARRLYTLSANQGYAGAVEALRDMREPVQAPRPAGQQPRRQRPPAQ